MRDGVADMNHTHEVKITMANEEPQLFKVTGRNRYMATVHALQQLYGLDRDKDLPAMIVKCEKVEK